MSTTLNSPQRPAAPKLTRRGFLKVAGLAVGAGAVACSGLGYLNSQAPKPAPVDTPEFSYGKENAMSQRVLVVYATAAGSTVGVAGLIGQTLGARGYAVDVQPVNANPAPDGYQAVILGSAVHGARWLPEAVAFARDHQAALRQVPVALFCVHIMNLGADEKSRRNRQAYLNGVRPYVSAVDEAYFAGKGTDPATASGVERFMAGLFNIATGDQRDWTKISAWAQTVNLLPAAG